MTRILYFLLAACVCFAPAPLWAADDPKPAAPPEAPAAKAATDVESLVQRVKASVVIVTHAGREATPAGAGTGFIIGSDGLIATNLHVIGEARPITVTLADGKKHEVTEVHASDRQLDLALLRIDAKGLPALPLGDSDTLKQGQAVIAMGNPLGLGQSVVQGIVSAVRQVGERPMIQLAMPIEPGNSGGPVIDMDGRVHGIITLKSRVTENLGFAVPINQLKPLIAKPNPVPMSRWLTIGALDDSQWEPLFGAHWRQRAGHITVSGFGQGFGGRSLCLSKEAPPARPFELAVAVKLDDEAGAAGLVFAADGEHKHYGFYPSGGQLRLSRFDGPDVFTWRVLREVASPAYRPGEWNNLKVRLDKDKVLCFVNDELVIEERDGTYTTGRVGLAKFRQTEAEFRGFRVGAKLPSSRPADDLVAKVTEQADRLPPDGELPGDLIEALAPQGPATRTVLNERAKALERQAQRLRELADAVHAGQVTGELAQTLAHDEGEIDLAYAALLLAKLDNPELDVPAYRQELDRMAAQVKRRLPDKADDQAKLDALHAYLYEENGFHGSRSDYYHRSNSYLNEVLDDREGLPITLSILHMELAQRLGLNVVGAALPGHFMAQYLPAEGAPRFIDVFEGGKVLTRQQADAKIAEVAGVQVTDEQVKPPTKKAIIIRMLHNLMSAARQDESLPRTLHYLDAILAIEPASPEERVIRAVLRYRSGRLNAALADTDWLLEHEPESINLDRVRELRDAIQRAQR